MRSSVTGCRKRFEQGAERIACPHVSAILRRRIINYGRLPIKRAKDGSDQPFKVVGWYGATEDHAVTQSGTETN